MSRTFVFQIVRLFVIFSLFPLMFHPRYNLFFFFFNISLPSLTGAITVPTSSQRKPSMLSRSTTLLSRYFCIFHTKQSTVRITFSHCKRHHLQSRIFPTLRTETEEYLLRWCHLSIRVLERYFNTFRAILDRLSSGK